jgi:hypothetical protein
MAYPAALDVQVPEVFAGLDVDLFGQPALKLSDDDFFAIRFVAVWRFVLKEKRPHILERLRNDVCLGHNLPSSPRAETGASANPWPHGMGAASPAPSCFITRQTLGRESRAFFATYVNNIPDRRSRTI